MNIQQLEYLLALRKHRHFVKAAEECGVTQPTLSAMISRLEDELGVKLIERTAHPLSLTPIGDKVADHAAEVLISVRGITDIVAEEIGECTGDINIGILPTITPFLLPKLIRMHDRIAEKMNVRFFELTTAQCEARLLDGSLDLAIVAGDLKESRYTSHTLYYEEFVGYVSRNEPQFASEFLRSSELNPDRLWLLDEGHCFRNQLVRFCSLAEVHERRINYVLNGIETYMHLVEEGRGITFVPELAVETMSKQQKELLRRFAIPRPVRPIMLIHSPSYMRESVVQHLAEIIREAVPSRLHTLGKDQTLATKEK